MLAYNASFFEASSGGDDLVPVSAGERGVDITMTGDGADCDCDDLERGRGHLLSHDYYLHGNVSFTALPAEQHAARRGRRVRDGVPRCTPTSTTCTTR